MKRITDAVELKNIILGILDDVTNYCDAHNIKYYLAFGTLLGAVRHKGFIPWDDDLDIMMPREDYERFINHYQSKRYKCIHIRNNNSYFYPFAKVYDSKTRINEDIVGSTNFGIYIDIFPIDGIPNKHPILHQRKLLFLQNRMKNKYSPMNRPRNFVKQKIITIVKLLLKPVSLRSLGNLVDNIAKTIPYKTSKSVGVVVWGYAFKSFEKSMLGNGIKMRFENNAYTIPTQYDKLLHIIYGDYMKLPPKSQRVPVHNFKAYYRNK